MASEIVEIAEHICLRMCISSKDVLGDSKFREHVRVRHVLMLVAMRKLKMTSAGTGRRLGKDHSTVLNGRDQALMWLQRKEALTLRAYKLAIRYIVQRKRK